MKHMALLVDGLAGCLPDRRVIGRACRQMFIGLVAMAEQKHGFNGRAGLLFNMNGRRDTKGLAG